MSHDVAMRSIDLMAQEVIPAVKEYDSAAVGESEGRPPDSNRSSG